MDFIPRPSTVCLTIWTLGHSTRGATEFLALLAAYRIELIADVRRFPGSRRLPQFSAAALEEALGTSGIAYRWFPELGGRRRADPASANLGWRHPAFRGYADHVATEEFATGLGELLMLAPGLRTAVMCAEVLWWRCHRRLIADVLTSLGVSVVHVRDERVAEVHRLAAPARLLRHRLTYSLCAVLLLLMGACRSGEQPAPAADDRAPAMISEQEFLERQLASDSVSGLAVAAVQDLVVSESAERAPEAAPSELRALADALVMPLPGVTPAELVGSFDDARGARRHEALDIPAPRGTPVISATAGRLMKLHTSDFGGLMVYAADASERFILLYAHLDRYAEELTEGMPLRRGQVVGYVGTTGNAPPDVPHLHFGIARVADVEEWWRGQPVDPLPLLRDSLPGRPAAHLRR